MTRSSIRQPEQDRALAYLASTGAKCATCRHFRAAGLKCDITGQTQSPHGLCLQHQAVKAEREARA